MQGMLALPCRPIMLKNVRREIRQRRGHFPVFHALTCERAGRTFEPCWKHAERLAVVDSQGLLEREVLGWIECHRWLCCLMNGEPYGRIEKILVLKKASFVLYLAQPVDARGL